MNEIQFHTKLMTNPYQLDEDMLQFLEQNPEKKLAVQKVRELDKDISNTLAIGVPEGLHARILLNQSYQQNQQQQSISAEAKQANAPSWLGYWSQSWKGSLAASVVAFALVFGLWQPQSIENHFGSEQMVNHILAHVEEDPDLMTKVQLPNEQGLQKLFATVGAQLSQSVSGMTFAGICDVEGERGLHIVMQQNGEPVTIIVMPGHQVDATLAFNKSGFHGELIPVEGGMVAILGNTIEHVALAQTAFFKAVKFA